MIIASTSGSRLCPAPAIHGQSPLLRVLGPASLQERPLAANVLTIPQLLAQPLQLHRIMLGIAVGEETVITGMDVPRTYHGQPSVPI